MHWIFRSARFLDGRVEIIIRIDGFVQIRQSYFDASTAREHIRPFKSKMIYVLIESGATACLSGYHRAYG